jgi:phosphoadenosine phosphosulfate reductase
MALELTQANIESVDAELQAKSPKQIIKYALEQYDSIAISFSGAEDVVLLDMALKYRPDVQVFTLDTGRLHIETYEYLEAVRKHYDIKLEVLSPEADAVQKLVQEKGLFSFYDGDHKECCGVRKIAPLRKKLKDVDAWITGQRKDQSPSTRAAVNTVEIDPAFHSDENTLLKFNPLANWTSQQVWDYIRAFEVPFNPLHQQGFKSIGCQPCTRPTMPNQHEREGRWWWEEATAKECGLHSGNVITKA